MRPDTEKTIDLDGEEVSPSELTFFSLIGEGLVVHHMAWAQEKLDGPGGTEPDPMVFGETEMYTPKGAVEARELLNHPHRQGNSGGHSWFCLEPLDSEVPDTPAGADEIPDGYAKVDGEVVPVEELLAGQTNGGASSPAEKADQDQESDSDQETGTTSLEPLSAPGDEEITTKQGAVEALSAAGVDLSAEEAPSPHDTKDDIIAYAHEQGYRFPNYE